MTGLPQKTPPYFASRHGFTLIEAMVAVTITAMAAAAVLLGIETAMQTTSHGVEQCVAQGLAGQLMDEICGNRYVEYGVDPYQTVLCANAAELAPGTRELFDDIDDFHGQEASPPESPRGVKLGQDNGTGGVRNANFRAPRKLLNRLKRTAEVFYVDENNFANRLSAGQTSDYRGIEVSVFYIEENGDERELVRLRRIVAYVPPSN